MLEVFELQKLNRGIRNKIEKDNSILKITIKSVVLALIISLICIIIYAIVLSITPVSDNTMSIVTQLISMISILAAGIYCGMRVNRRGWLYGLIVGIVYIVILIPIGMLWGQTITFDKYFLARLLLASSVGLIGGIIGVNIA